MLIVGINGSPHKNGNTTFLLNTLGEKVKELGAEFMTISVADAFSDVSDPFCLGCQQGIKCDGHCYKGTKLEKSFELLGKADAIVIGSPVQFCTVSGLLKCYFDKTLKLRVERRLMGKIGAAISVGGAKNGGQESAIRTMHELMLVHGMAVISDSSFESGAGHFGITAQAPAENDTKAIERIRILAEGLVEFAKRR